MILNFIKAMWTWVRGGFTLNEQVFIDMRWSVCNDCEHKKVGCIRTQCTLCKCTISEKKHPFNKLAHPCQECPIRKWSKVHGINCKDD